jgi:hypothetical protein
MRAESREQRGGSREQRNVPEILRSFHGDGAGGAGDASDIFTPHGLHMCRIVTGGRDGEREGREESSVGSEEERRREENSEHTIQKIVHRIQCTEYNA